MAEMMKGVTGVVLAGGESRRFGSNKALASWKGKTMVEGVVEILSGMFPSNLVVVKNPESFPFWNKTNVRVVKDMTTESHSLGGIWSGLSHAATEHVFVCACDMPFLRPKLVKNLWDAGRGYDAVIPVWREKPQPLCGIYSKKCRGVIECLIKDQRLKIQELFDIVRTRFYLEAEVKSADPAGLSFVDLDTRQEYERARRKKPC
ncbi:MAG: molybdenum cofactor guanylyltransferase [Elusimicrobia bacterium]|nr:molybdenum cofactor guanylyltransferase [Elusimicrobiota bacterium]